MSKPIIFCDFDGTICFDRYWRSLPADKYEQVQEMLFRNDRTIVRAWMRGENTAEEVNRLVAKRLGMPYDELWDLFVRDCSTMRVDPEILNKLHALRDRYTTVLITGNMDSFTRFTVPSLELQKFFDHISNSFYEKKHKSDNGGELFVEWANKIGTPIQQCIVFDDSAEVCEIFGKLGGRVCKVGDGADIDLYLKDLN